LVYYFKAFLRAVYPAINATYYFSTLAFNLAYLFDKSPYHTPLDYLVGIRMRRLTGADHRAFDAASGPSSRPGIPPLSARSLLTPSIFTNIILPKLLDSLKILLPTSIFFLKFLEWWHASDFARQLSAKTAASIELPPPVRLKPPPPESMEDGVVKKLVKAKEAEESDLCPICDREITNPTATQSGYVFCYPCVFKWVQDGDGPGFEGDDERKGRCPVSGVRLLGGTEGLRRLMI
jgi:peroxin-12